MLAPWERLELEDDAPAVGVEVDVEVDPAVAVAEFEADADVDVAVVNRLESVASSWIWIGCAHIVIGPETCVLSPGT
jgi:hypothetical protein